MRSRDNRERWLIGEAFRAAPSDRSLVEPHRAVAFGAHGARTHEHHIALSPQDVEYSLVGLA